VRGTSPLSLPDAVANSLQYVKAFGGTYQGNIPQAYTQVNYVTNTAQTAVNTGIMIDFAKNYEFEVECRATNNSWYILQSRTGLTGNITGISGATSGNTITLVVGNVTACTSAITRTVGNKLYVKATLNNGTATLYVKDETANTDDTQTGSYGVSQPNPTAPVYLLGNAGGQYVQVNNDIYMMRIKENGVVVADYIPCRQSANAGFYDKASGTFKQALTPANLTADGNTVPTPDAPMDIVCNNGVLKARHASGLPAGYTRLEYLQSSGTQYIDTSIAPKTFDYEITTVGTFNTTSSGPNVMWGYLTSGDGMVPRWILSTYMDKWLPSPNGTTEVGVADTLKHTFVNMVYMENETPTSRFYVDGSQLQSTTIDNPATWANNTLSIYLFGRNNNGTLGNATASKIYRHIVKKNGTVIQDLVPAKNNSNVLGMYDTVSGQFFTNAGTGTFTAGDPVSDPVEIYTDGTVETVWVHGKNLFDKTAITANSYVNASGGVTSDGTNRTVVSGEIYVKPSTTYTLSGVGNIYNASYNRSGFQYQADGTSISAITATQDTGKVTFTTAANCAYIRVMSLTGSVDTAMLEQSPTATTYEPYYDGGTATAEMLLKVGDYQDVQEILAGDVTRKVGVKVLDGTEDWQNAATTDRYLLAFSSNSYNKTNNKPFCTHFCGRNGVTGSVSVGMNDCAFYIGATNDWEFYVGMANTTVAGFKQFLADQYTAGTPVIVVYPLATETTESVAGQTLQVQAGDNTLEITQASMTGLELEAKYLKSA